MKKPIRTTGVHDPDPDPIPAITKKEIQGLRIPTIPIGTKFTVTYIHKGYSICQGLPIDMIWNHEYELIKEDE